MAYDKTNTDWISKEMRELYCKSINTLLMQGMEPDAAMKIAKSIIDTAFKNYPDNTEPVGEKLENIIN